MEEWRCLPGKLQSKFPWHKWHSQIQVWHSQPRWEGWCKRRHGRGWLGSELSSFFGDSISWDLFHRILWTISFKFHSLVIQCPFTIIIGNQLSKTTVMLKVKGKEEQGLPSDRIMIGGFSQVLNDKKFLNIFSWPLILRFQLSLFALGWCCCPQCCTEVSR